MSNRPADSGSELIAAAYAAWRDEFTAITARASRRFSERDWAGSLADQAARLTLYRSVLDTCVAGLRDLLGERLRDRSVWAAMKGAFERAVEGAAEPDLAETFFNSATRRIFSTVGVDPAIEFVSTAVPDPDEAAAGAVVDRFDAKGARTRDVLLWVLEAHPLRCGWQDPKGDSAAAAGIVDRATVAAWGTPGFDEAEVIRPVFFRSKGAYVVGRLRKGERLLPLVLAIRNPAGKAIVDAALLDEDEVSVVFSFTRSYFKVDAPRAEGIVGFLRSIMPRKPLAELYSSLGHEKHGKTELYRDVLRHLARTDEKFVLAAGVKGMVMIVFTLPGLDVVFKVIRDSFAPPKTTTRERVLSMYRLVHRHGRAGRLVDALEFEHLKFDRDRFEPACLAELLEGASDTVRAASGSLSIRHLFTERRLVPLDLHLQSASAEERRRAAIDYGRCLKELAATNVFPGDLLLKNFGVTRHGRVVFYDYDEIQPLLDVRFREIPSRGGMAGGGDGGYEEDEDDGGGGEPSFFVGENDVFPEEFFTFLGLRGPASDAFLAEHRDLLTPAFWTGMQRRVAAGEIVDIYPYPDERRLHRRS